MKKEINYYGTGLFDTPFTIKKWILSWHFPFLSKVVVWKGTPIQAQEVINKIISNK